MSDSHILLVLLVFFFFVYCGLIQSMRSYYSGYVRLCLFAFRFSFFENVVSVFVFVLMPFAVTVLADLKLLFPVSHPSQVCQFLVLSLSFYSLSIFHYLFFFSLSLSPIGGLFVYLHLIPGEFSCRCCFFLLAKKRKAL